MTTITERLEEAQKPEVPRLLNKAKPPERTSLRCWPFAVERSRAVFWNNLFYEEPNDADA